MGEPDDDEVGEPDDDDVGEPDDDEVGEPDDDEDDDDNNMGEPFDDDVGEPIEEGVRVPGLVNDGVGDRCIEIKDHPESKSREGEKELSYVTSGRALESRVGMVFR